jgi:hypothetical protein
MRLGWKRKRGKREREREIRTEGLELSIEPFKDNGSGDGLLSTRKKPPLNKILAQSAKQPFFCPLLALKK